MTLATATFNICSKENQVSSIPTYIRVILVSKLPSFLITVSCILVGLLLLHDETKILICLAARLNQTKTDLGVAG